MVRKHEINLTSKGLKSFYTVYVMQHNRIHKNFWCGIVMEVQCILMCHFQLSQRTLQWDQFPFYSHLRTTHQWESLRFKVMKNTRAQKSWGAEFKSCLQMHEWLWANDLNFWVYTAIFFVPKMFISNTEENLLKLQIPGSYSRANESERLGLGLRKMNF